jgi:hypothetical protein
MSSEGRAKFHTAWRWGVCGVRQEEAPLEEEAPQPRNPFELPPRAEGGRGVDGRPGARGTEMRARGVQVLSPSLPLCLSAAM